ncbi:MAG: hypothetical protein WAJ85_10105 [Candidatus Baltobacteraceae bacterium]
MTDFREREGRPTGPNGLTAFHSLSDALRAGFQIEDRIEHGYVVRRQVLGSTGPRWERAVVDLRVDLR